LKPQGPTCQPFWGSANHRARGPLHARMTDCLHSHPGSSRVSPRTPAYVSMYVCCVSRQHRGHLGYKAGRQRNLARVSVSCASEPSTRYLEYILYSDSIGHNSQNDNLVAFCESGGTIVSAKIRWRQKVVVWLCIWRVCDHACMHNWDICR